MNLQELNEEIKTKIETYLDTVIPNAYNLTQNDYSDLTFSNEQIRVNIEPDGNASKFETNQVENLSCTVYIHACDVDFFKANRLCELATTALILQNTTHRVRFRLIEAPKLGASFDDYTIMLSQFKCNYHFQDS